jgi:hypothetical protein
MQQTQTRTKIIDLLKTVMIYVLTVSMLAFAGLYINDRQNAGGIWAPRWRK